jgi:PKD domain
LDVSSALTLVTLLMVILLVSLHTISTYPNDMSDILYAAAQQTALSTAPPPEIGVKITSPTTGQSVPAGNDQQLRISGSSTDDSISDCKVAVIVNGMKPYQPVTANGSSGMNDYSTWYYLLNSSYTSLRDSLDNKITSKLVCGPNLTKWYSVNVTGISLNSSMLKITSPGSDENISTGNMTVYGTSVDDYYKDCQVYVSKNNLPFRKATAAGLTGATDFSAWKFTYNDDYASITPGNSNNLAAKLSCGDSLNSQTADSRSTYATVNVIGVNQPPVAEAKVDKDEVREGDEVILNGEESNDPSGDSLIYLWKQTDDSIEKVSILDANSAVSNFRVPDKLEEDTTFEITLFVTDEYGETATKTVSIEAIANSEPEADSGGDKEAVIGEQVTLDGSGSRDPDQDGMINSYRWEQTEGPSVSLQGSNQPVASFSVPTVEEDTTFGFTLTVTDNEGAESDDGAEVRVEAPSPQPQAPNQSGEVCLDEIDNNNNGLVDEDCETELAPVGG